MVGAEFAEVLCVLDPPPLRVGKEGDVGTARRDFGTLKQADDERADLRGRPARPQLRVCAPKHIRLYSSQAKADRADPIGATLDGERLRQSNNPVLRDVVGSQARKSLCPINSSQQREIHDPATSRIAHQWECLPAA